MRWLMCVFSLQAMLVGGENSENNPLACSRSIYNGSSFSAQELEPCNSIVLRSALCRLHEELLYAPVNLREVSCYAPHFHDGEDPILAHKEKGAFFAELRQERRLNCLADKMVSDLIVQGFQGVLIDALDDVLDVDKKENERVPGIKKSAIQLIRLIRAYSPSLLIMVNRSCAFLPQIEDLINTLLRKAFSRFK